MTKRSIHGFDEGIEANNSGLIDIESNVSQCLAFIEEDSLNERQVSQLVAALYKSGAINLDSAATYDADFDLSSEIANQIQMVRALRSTVMIGGDIVHGTNISEASKVVKLCADTIQMLMKSHEKIQSMERHRAVESAVIATLVEVGEDGEKGEALVSRYLQLLDTRLEDIA